MSSQAQNTNWLKLIASPLNATLDIVAVHGMNPRNQDDHADNTWTDKESGTNWLRDLLPPRIPKARILAYQYNANVAFGTSAAGVEEQAKNMLNCLSLERKFNNTRPIIFIAHSMGGIIVKEALVSACYGDGTHAMISTITYGIAFFGVPHRGSKYATWGRMAASIIGTFANQSNDSFLRSVELGSAYNEMLNSKFEPLLQRYKFFSICETLPDTIEGRNVGIIVDKDSAILGLSDEQELKYFPNRSHRTVCKFASSTEPEWMHISQIICHASILAVNSVSYSPTVLEHKKRFQGFSWYAEEETQQRESTEEVIKRAEEVLVNIEQGSIGELHLHEIQGELDLLSTLIKTLVAWFTPVLFLAVSSFMLHLLLPRKETITDKVEEARQTERKAVELEQLTIEILDSQRYCALRVIAMLQNTFNFDSSENEESAGVPNSARAAQLLRQLDNQAVRIMGELRDHNEAYGAAKKKLNLIEEGQREMEGMEVKEIVKLVKERVKKESASASEGEIPDPWCGSCVIL